MTSPTNRCVNLRHTTNLRKTRKLYGASKQHRNKQKFQRTCQIVRIWQESGPGVLQCALSAQFKKRMRRWRHTCQVVWDTVTHSATSGRSTKVGGIKRISGDPFPPPLREYAYLSIFFFFFGSRRYQRHNGAQLRANAKNERWCTFVWRRRHRLTWTDARWCNNEGGGGCKVHLRLIAEMRSFPPGCVCVCVLAALLLEMTQPDCTPRGACELVCPAFA